MKLLRQSRMGMDNLYMKTQTKQNFYQREPSEYNRTSTFIKVPKTQSLKKYNSQLIGTSLQRKYSSKSIRRSQSGTKQHIFKDAKESSLQKDRSNSLKKLIDNKNSPSKNSNKLHVPKKWSKEGGLVSSMNKNNAEQIINRLRNKNSLKIQYKDKQTVKDYLIKLDKKSILSENQSRLNIHEIDQNSQSFQQNISRKIAKIGGIEMKMAQQKFQQKTGRFQKIEQDIQKKSMQIQRMMSTFEQTIQKKQQQMLQRQKQIIKKQRQLQKIVESAIQQNKKIEQMRKLQLKQLHQRSLLNKKNQSSISDVNYSFRSQNVSRQKLEQMQTSHESAKKNNKYFVNQTPNFDQVQQMLIADKVPKNNNKDKEKSIMKPQQQLNITIKKPKDSKLPKISNNQVNNQIDQFQKTIQNKPINKNPLQIQKPTISAPRKPSISVSQNQPQINKVQPVKPESKKPQSKNIEKQKVQQQSINALIKVIPRMMKLIYFIGEVPYFCTSNMKKNKKFSFKNASLLLYKYVLDKFQFFQNLYSQLWKKKALTKEQYEQRVEQNVSIKETYMKIKGYSYKKQPYPSKQSQKYLDEQSKKLCFQDKLFFKNHLFKQIKKIITFYHDQTKGTWEEHQVNICYFRMMLSIFIIEEIEFGNIILECDQNEEFPDYQLDEVQKLTQNQLKQRMTECYQIIADLGYD